MSKSYKDLLAEDGERIAFLILVKEFEKANEIIKEYEKTDCFNDGSDEDLFIAITFLKVWLTFEWNCNVPLSEMRDTNEIIESTYDFIPANPFQKIFLLLIRQYEEYGLACRMLKKALLIARKDPSLIRERALTLFFISSLHDEFMESEIDYEIELKTCVETLYGPSSWKTLFAKTLLCSGIINEEDKEQGRVYFRDLATKLRSLEGEKKLLLASFIEDNIYLFSGEEKESLIEERKQIAKKYGSANNPLATPLMVLSDKNTLSKKLGDLEKKKEAPEYILQFFQFNSFKLPDSEVINSLDYIINALSKLDGSSLGEYKGTINSLKRLFSEMKESDPLFSYFLKKAENVDGNMDIDLFRVYCEIIAILPESFALSFTNEIEKKLPKESEHYIRLLCVKAVCLRRLNRMEEVTDCYKTLIKGYESLGIEPDDAYYLAHFVVAFQYLHEYDNPGRFLRYMKKAAKGYEELYGEDSDLALKCYLQLGTYYSEAKDISFESALEVYDKVLSLCKKRGPEYYLEYFHTKTHKGLLLISFGKIKEALSMNKETLEEAVKITGEDSEFTREARLDYASALFMNGVYEEAINLFLDVLKCYQEWGFERINSLTYLMLSYHKIGRDKEAYAIAQNLKMMEKKIENDEHKGSLYLVLSDMYYDNGDYKKCNRYRERAKELVPFMFSKEGGENERLPFSMPIRKKY